MPFWAPQDIFRPTPQLLWTAWHFQGQDRWCFSAQGGLRAWGDPSGGWSVKQCIFNAHLLRPSNCLSTSFLHLLKAACSLKTNMFSQAPPEPRLGSLKADLSVKWSPIEGARKIPSSPRRPKCPALDYFVVFSICFSRSLWWSRGSKRCLCKISVHLLATQHM